MNTSDGPVTGQRTLEVAGPGPVTFTGTAYPNVVWWTLGLGMGLTNAVRHRIRGYRTPRPFSLDEVERSVDYVLEVVDRWRRHGELHLGSRRVLELGPGPDLGTGAVMLALGAASYTATDLFPLAAETPSSFYDVLASRIGRPIDPEELAYVVTRYPDMPGLEGPFDVVVSNAALEHFDDIPATFARLAELVPPGGVMCHHVDGMVHMRGIRARDPLNLLRYPGWIYRAMSFPGVPNRLRPSDFLMAARATGWSGHIVPDLVAPASYLNGVRPGLSRTWRARPGDDLATLTFTLVCVRE